MTRPIGNGELCPLRSRQESNERLVTCALLFRADLARPHLDSLKPEMFDDELARALAGEAVHLICQSGQASARMVGEAVKEQGRFGGPEIEGFIRSVEADWPAEALPQHWIDEAVAALVDRVDGLALDKALRNAARALGDSKPARDVAATLRAALGGPKARGGKPRKPDLDWRPLPIPSLPAGIRSFVSVSAQAIGCDTSYVALPLLVALASAIGNTRRIELKRGWTEPAVLWGAIVGESGTLKSPAIDLPLRPIRRRQAQALRDFRAAMDTYRIDREAHDAELKDWQRARRKDGVLAVIGHQETPPTPPDEPVCERYWCSDITVEALADRLQTAPRGLLVARDELSGLLRGFDRYKAARGGDVAHWLEMHRAGHLLVDRKTDRAVIHVPRAAVSIIGGIQPAILKLSLAGEHFEDGLAARFLLAMPPRKPKRWTEQAISQVLEDELGDIFDRLLSLDPNIDTDGEPQPVTLGLNREGKAAWVTFYNEHAAEQMALAGDLAAAWSKLEAAAARLALVIHLVRWAADDPTLADPYAVDGQSVEAGVTLARWFGHEARRVYAILSESDEDRERRELIELIERRGRRITVRELQRASRRFKDAEAAELALNDLAGAGYGRWEYVEPGAKGGRPTHVFHLSMGADADRTPESPEHHAGFVSADPDTFEERAASLEYDAGLPRAEAEAKAAEEVGIQARGRRAGA